MGIIFLLLIELHQVFIHFWGSEHYVFVDDQVVKLLGILGWRVFASSLCYNG